MLLGGPPGLAAEAQAAAPPLPANGEARLDLAAMALAEEIRALRGPIPAPALEYPRIASTDLDV